MIPKTVNERQDHSTSPSTQAPDEVNLTEIMFSVIRYFEVQKFILLAWTAVGLAAGAAYYKLKPNLFESKMVGECQALTDGRIVDLLLVLEKLRENKDWATLSQVLAMPKDQVNKLKKIEPLSTVGIEKKARGVDDYLLPTTEVAYQFGLTVLVKDNAILPALQNGISHYLTENAYSKTRVERFLENRKTLLTFINREIQILDSLNIRFAQKVVAPNTQSQLMVGPGDYKAILVDLKERALSLEDQIEYADAVRIIQPFTPMKNPVEPNLKQVLLLFGLLGFGFGILFTGILKIALAYRNFSRK